MSSQPPIWLDEATEIRALLAAVVDRFDAQSGESRARNLVLRAEAQLPGLGRNDPAADQTWAFVRELEALGVLVIQSGRRGPYDSPWTGAKLKFAPASEASLRDWLSRPASPSAGSRWRAAVAQCAHAFADRGAALGLRRIAIAGRTDEQVVAALATLASIDRPATLRQLSAHAFWGDSKVLDDRADLIAVSFPQLAIRERKIIVACHLPARIEGVLFIENQDTYAATSESEPQAAQLALVYMAGFRGAAGRVRNSDGAVLHFSGVGYTDQAPRFRSWWFQATAEAWPLHFWGDLDFAGMQILRALRSRFAAVVAWEPGYARMLDELTRLGAHGATDLRGQIDPVGTGCPYADSVLLPAIRAHGFRDQERIAGAWPAGE